MSVFDGVYFQRNKNQKSGLVVRCNFPHQYLPHLFQAHLNEDGEILRMCLSDEKHLNKVFKLLSHLYFSQL